MPRQIKAFVTCDSYVDNSPAVVSPLYEISDLGLTYSTTRQQYYSTQDSTYTLFVFKEIDSSGLSQTEVDKIIDVVKSFVAYATRSSELVGKQQLIISFTNDYNTLNQTQLTDLTFTSYVQAGETVGCDYMHFTILGIECGVWLNDVSFRNFYPDYEIKLVMPFEEFESIVQNGSAMISAIANFNLVRFNQRIEEAKHNRPSTHVRIINIPYQLPNTSVKRDCYFGFIQYGSQGNFDYVLKLQLYQYLLSLGMSSDYVESIFPSILEINEFFITPRWDRVAIPSRVGLNGIASQVSNAFAEVFDLDKFIKVYPDINYLKANSYNVPYDYNNILLTISNGFYSEDHVRDFKAVYPDLISVTSTHPDYARMSSKSQKFVSLLESMSAICDSENATKMFTKMMDNDYYIFTLVNRQDIWYLSSYFDGHQYYMIPKYEYLSKLA